MGDTFFNQRYPFIDVSTGGSVDGVIAAADRVLRETGERTRIIPGHGPLASRADLVAYRDMLVAVSARIREGIRSGRTPEQIQASKPAAEFEAVWGKGSMAGDRFVQMLHRSLAR